MTMIKDFLLAQFALLEKAPSREFETVISQENYEKYAFKTTEKVPSESLATEINKLTSSDFYGDSDFARTSRDFFVKELALLLTGNISKRALYFLATMGTIERTVRDLLIFTYLQDGYKKNMFTQVEKAMLLCLEQQFHLYDTIKYTAIVTLATKDLPDTALLHAFLEEILDSHILQIPASETNSEYRATNMEEIQKLADQIKIDRKKAI